MLLAAAEQPIAAALAPLSYRSRQRRPRCDDLQPLAPCRAVLKLERRLSHEGIRAGAHERPKPPVSVASGDLATSDTPTAQAPSWRYELSGGPYARLG